jgi:tRNA dimethylallyltransferase
MSLLVAVVGPTGVGKSRLALRLAETFDGEIVNADSRQVYRYLDIGTAKSTREELSRVTHHLIDIVSPDEAFSLAQYQELAVQAIRDIQRRGKMALLVGGSGLYVWSVVENWQIPRVPPNLAFRQELEEKARKGGRLELYRELLRVEPLVAQKIDPQNTRRIIRALEVHRETAVPFSNLQRKNNAVFRTYLLGMTQERDRLYQRIDRRVDIMMKLGLVDEVKNLAKMSYDFTLPALSAIGYRQVAQYLKDEISLEEATRKIKFETHRYVRSQYNWFRLKDDRIEWFDVDRSSDSKITARLSQLKMEEYEAKSRIMP